ncbi:MAG: M23 family metallopeptidase [Clostridia bacterium]|nr:M23 family metallopeptidase [Clostridia bacterium]
MSKFYRNNKGFLGVLTKGSGLYLLLGGSALAVLCLAALLFAPGGDDRDVSLPTDAPSLQSSVQGSQSVTDSQTDTDVASDPSDSAANAPADDPEAVEDVLMILPVTGTVGTDFSLTVPVFSETMNDWRVHQGIDFLTEGEAEVRAVADGIVENVYISELMGRTVEIRHADGTLSIYQSLAEGEKVIEGQEVKQGDLLGMTGISADSESLEGHHLHFALLRDGVYLDPNPRFVS